MKARSERFIHWFNIHWFVLFVFLYAVFVGLPFLAPVLMQTGWVSPGKAIYFVYSFFCHQLPQRSFFLFGPKSMVSLQEIKAVWNKGLDPFTLRQFIGSQQLGWKVAWSDRMVSMYTSILILALLWRPFRNRIKPLSLWAFILLLVPMAIDGGSHLVGDLAGFGRSFRETNTWLAVLTNHAFLSTFYVGDALGSFNSWIRLVTGILFGLGIVWLCYPYIHEWIKWSIRVDREDSRYWRLSSK